MAEKKLIWATGRRKSAIARINLEKGNGKIKVNGKAFEKVFPTEALRGFINQPLAVTDSQGKYNITATIKGGGISGQSGALRHAISRALVKEDESMKSVLKNSNMLTRDDRVKERKKTGQPGARRKFQFSKR